MAEKLSNMITLFQIVWIDQDVFAIQRNPLCWNWLPPKSFLPQALAKILPQLNIPMPPNFDTRRTSKTKNSHDILLEINKLFKEVKQDMRE